MLTRSKVDTYQHHHICRERHKLLLFSYFWGTVNRSARASLASRTKSWWTARSAMSSSASALGARALADGEATHRRRYKRTTILSSSTGTALPLIFWEGFNRVTKPSVQLLELVSAQIQFPNLCFSHKKHKKQTSNFLCVKSEESGKNEFLYS